MFVRRARRASLVLHVEPALFSLAGFAGRPSEGPASELFASQSFLNQLRRIVGEESLGEVVDYLLPENLFRACPLSSE